MIDLQALGATRLYAPGELEREHETVVASIEEARQRIEMARSNFAKIEGEVAQLLSLPDGHWFGAVALPRTEHPADIMGRSLAEAEKALPARVEMTEEGIRSARAAIDFAYRCCLRSVKDLVLRRLNEMEHHYTPHEAPSRWRDEIRRREGIARRLPH